jgi:CCR4-NOT transcription complex subunit 2
MPKDILQAYAAQELYQREWRYHVELKLWFKRATAEDGINPGVQGVQYIYFDINSWERRIFAGNIHGGLNNGLLSEEDVVVGLQSGPDGGVGSIPQSGQQQQQQAQT